MKYVVIVGDGMADRPLANLKGRTPLEAARTPNMDLMAQKGTCGMVRTVPAGVKPGSDVANFSIFGYDPRKYFMGRGPLEALSQGIKLKNDEVAYRCNLVRAEKGKMADYSAGHITTKEADKIIKLLNRELGNKRIRFHTGVGYRHLVIIKNGPEKVKCTPPHDITGKNFAKYLPKGPGADSLNILMSDSYEILSSLGLKANMIWLWGQGKRPKMNKFPLKGSVITAVDLIKGIGKAIGLKVIDVPGATGYFDTNFKGKAEYALRSLNNNDFVFVHIEAPDEAGHEGMIKEKIKAIENIDRYVVGTILKGIKKFKRYKIMVLPDHATPISLMTHSGEPVPFAIYGAIRSSVHCDCGGYNEKNIKGCGLKFEQGHRLMDYFIRRA